MDSASTYSHNRAHDSLEDLAFLKDTGHDNDPTGEDSTLSPADGYRKLRFLWFVLAIQIVFDVVIIVTGIVYFVKEGSKDYGNPQMLYSPVQHLLEYETKVFYEGFGADRSMYQQPPSPEVDAAWEDLYNFGVSRITKEEASRLVNYTYRLPGDEDHHVIQLDVFHQLHCLNMVRKALHPEYYHKETDPLDKLEHWDHCIESIRQSLVCSADVSPLVWQWVDRVQEVRLAGNIIHTCRNYEKIKRWGLERRLDHPLNFTGFK